MSIHINTCQYISIHVNTYHTSSHKQKGFWTHNKGLVFNHQVECSSTNPLCGLDSQTQHQSLSGLAAKMNQKRWQKHVNAVDFPFHNYQGLKLKNTECIHSMKHSPWTFLDFLNALEKWCLFFEFICGHLGRPKDSCSKSYFKKACHNDGLQTANLPGQLFEIIQIPYFGSSYHEPSSATRGMTMALKTWTNLTKNVQKSPRLYNKVQVHTTFNIYSATVSKGEQILIQLETACSIGEAPWHRKSNTPKVGQHLSLQKTSFPARICFTKLPFRKSDVFQNSFAETADYRLQTGRATYFFWHACYKFDHTGASFSQSPKLLRFQSLFLIWKCTENSSELSS